MHIIVSKEIESVCPNFVGAAVEAQVVNTPYNAALWDEIHTLEARFREELTTESLKELSGIAATRRVYKACGKDPSRYRPASEQLIRRMLQGKELASPTATASAASMPTSSWATPSPWG